MCPVMIRDFIKNNVSGCNNGLRQHNTHLHSLSVDVV